MNRLTPEARARVIRSLVEGNSINSTCRITGVAQMTVLKLIADVGTACAQLQDRWLRDLTSERVQVDEMWSFVGMKAKNVPEEKRNLFGFGDVWTWIAIDADTKLVITWLVADRSQGSAVEFMKDLASRLRNRVQLTTDGYRPYNLAVSAFHRNVDYAQIIKVYADAGKEDRRRYSPSRYITSEIKVLIGDPDPANISTSYAERNNLNVRMMMRRMTRLTNAFSKKVENHAHQHAINFAYYNFCRIHKTLRCTPAMATGVTASPWDISDLVYITDEREIMSKWDLRTIQPPHPHVA